MYNRGGMDMPMSPSNAAGMYGAAPGYHTGGYPQNLYAGGHPQRQMPPHHCEYSRQTIPNISIGISFMYVVHNFKIPKISKSKMLTVLELVLLAYFPINLSMLIFLQYITA